MADVQPTPQAAPPTPPPEVSSQPAPDLSGLLQPGTSGPSRLDAVGPGGVSVNQAQANEGAAVQKATQIANTPTPAPSAGGHSRLLAMIQGLGIGLSSFGAALGSHGREGGAPEVQEYYAKQQEQKLQAQQAATAQKNAQIQQQLTIADTNRALITSMVGMMTLPNELTLNDLKVSEAQQNIASSKASLASTQAEFMSTYGMTPEQFNGMMAGGSTSVAPGGGPNAQNLQAFSQQKIDAAAKILSAGDPYVQKAQEVLSNPKATPQEVFGAVASVNRQVALQGQVTENKTKQEAAAANSPVGKLSTPEALAEPGAKAAIEAKIADPKTDPNDVPRLQALLPLAAKAQQNKIDLDRRQKQMEQDIQNGDPNIVGQELASGLFAPSQVLSSRSMSKPFYSAVLKAADEYGKTHGMPELKDANGQPTGHYYDGAKAEAQFKYASNNQTQNVLNMVDALGQSGGVADILLQKGKGLANAGVPVFNSWEQALSYQTGGKGVPAYMPAAVDFADMYAKIMGAGTGSDTARLQALNLVMAAQNPEQREAAVNTLKETLVQRGKFIVRDNPFLRSMYPAMGQAVTPTQAAPANSAASKVHANLSDFANHHRGAKGDIYSDDGTIWYDAAGNLVPSK